MAKKYFTKKKRGTQRDQQQQHQEDIHYHPRDLERGSAPRTEEDGLSTDDEDVIPGLSYNHRTQSGHEFPGMNVYSSQASTDLFRSRRSNASEDFDETRSYDSLPFGDRSVDGGEFSVRRENLTQRPKEFRRSVSPKDPQQLQEGEYEDLYDSDSEVEEVSLNDQQDIERPPARGAFPGGRQPSGHLASFGSSWDSFAGKRPVRAQNSIARTVTSRNSKPSRMSSLRRHGDSITSFRDRKLSRHLSISTQERMHQHQSFASIDEEAPIEEEEEYEEEGFERELSTQSGTTPTSSEASTTKKEPSRFMNFLVWFDDWVKRKLQWIYVFCTLYVGPVMFALYAPQNAVTALFFVSIGCVTFVNAWMVCEVLCSFFYTARMRKLHHITRPELIGERRLGSIVCAYLPNELTVLIQTVKAIANTIHELPEGTTMDIVLAHNGGKKEQRIALLEDLRKIELELPPNVMVHELNVLSSRSKAENVNAALGFFQEIGDIRGQPFTQLAMYDADHQPIPQAWRYALETMQDQGASMVMGRCCVADGMKTIAIEFDILYAVAHAGGRCVRGFGFFGGSNGYWNAQVLIETGMDEGMLTEDVDSSFRAQSAGNYMTYDPTIVSYEESPPNFSSLFKQRLRWAQGWYEVTLRQITLPFRRAPGLNLWSRFCIFLLLPFRELYVYFSSFTVPIAVVYLTTRCSWACVDYRLLAFMAFCLVVPITMTIAAWNMTYDRTLNVHYRMPTLRPIDYFKFIIVSYPYELLKIHITVMGHARQALNLNKWVVTKRKSTTDRVAPTITPSMVHRTIPEMLIRQSPFARSTRQMFTGTYDEKRSKVFDHCSTDKPAVAASTPNTGRGSTERSSDDSFNKIGDADSRSSHATTVSTNSSRSPKKYNANSPSRQSKNPAMGISMTGELSPMKRSNLLVMPTQ